MQEEIKAVVVGWTGETGKEVLKSLSKASNVQNITLVGRRKMELGNDIKKDLFDQKVIDFEKVPQDLLSGHNNVFCLLGTTRGKSGKDGFIKVDKEYVINIANAAKAADVDHFHLMTSAGSTSKSPFLYPKTKGEVEEYCESLQFKQLTIYQPGLLLCERVENRTGERIAQGLMKPFYGWLGTSSGAIPCSAVANAMVESAQQKVTGKISNHKIGELSKQFLSKMEKPF